MSGGYTEEEEDRANEVAKQECAAKRPAVDAAKAKLDEAKAALERAEEVYARETGALDESSWGTLGGVLTVAGGMLVIGTAPETGGGSLILGGWLGIGAGGTGVLASEIDRSREIEDAALALEAARAAHAAAQAAYDEVYDAWMDCGWVHFWGFLLLSHAPPGTVVRDGTVYYPDGSTEEIGPRPDDD